MVLIYHPRRPGQEGSHEVHHPLISLFLIARMGPLQWKAVMAEKTLTAVSTSRSDVDSSQCVTAPAGRHIPGVPIKEDFQQRIAEGVQTEGLETMQGIKSRLYEGILQHEEKDKGIGHHDLA